MCHKVFPWAVLVVAVIIALVGVLAVTHPVFGMMMIAHFFGIMLPILGVGALLKYLFCGNHCSN